MMRRAAIAVFAMAALSLPVLSDENCVVPESFELSENDQSRLKNLETSRTRGLGGAMRSDNADERAVVAELFEPGVAPVDPDLLVGKYQCRTIKMGGLLPLVVYRWFQCEIGQEEAAFTVRKITGSQNFFGLLVPAGAGYAYRGAGHYRYEKQVRFYGDDPERDQVGCLSAVTKGNKHFMLELPFPKVESYHDVIEFKPAR